MKLSRYYKYKKTYDLYRLKNKKKIYSQQKSSMFGGNRVKCMERDGYKCIKCGLENYEHIIKYGRSLSVDHIDGKGCNSKIKNNKLSNLQTLCLKCHGEKDIRRRKSPPIGERNHLHKLKNLEVIEIRRLYSQGESYASISRIFKISAANISFIANRKTWKHLI